MKTRFTQIASPFILAALLTLSVPADGQRRSANSESVRNRNEQKEDTRKAAETNKSEEKKQVNAPAARRTSDQNKKAAPATQSTAPADKRRGTTAVQERKTSPQPTPNRTSSPGAVQRRTPETNSSNINKAPARNERESIRSNNPVRNGTPQGGAVTARARKEHNRTIYRVDSKDNRYTPARSFKGNNNTWSMSYARHHVHYNRRDDNFYRHYDHRKYAHWDNSWETYRWNVNSWRDYYSGYHPHSYRFHKQYYYHPGYGHVVRKFGYNPDYFVHNNTRYYNYNGHFFRHFRGVGYVLVDMPYGLVFQKLPRNTERVYINGYLYFRSGNLFFENNPYGFALIHYPERYFALDSDYYNGGYYREVDFYIYR